MAEARGVDTQHHYLVGRIREVSDISSASVLAIGTSLTEVVQSALDIRELISRLGTAEAAADASPEALAKPVEAFGVAAAEALRRSRELLEQAQMRANRVGEACDELLQVTEMCRTLVMHTRIESARLGGVRGGISATGEHMNTFTVQMVEATRQAQEVQGDLVNLLGDLVAALDRFSQRADEMRAGLEQRLQELVANDAVRLRRFGAAVGRLTEAADQLVERSQEAVSVLQFQDPAIQRLQRLDSLAVDLRRKLGDEGCVYQWGERLGDRSVDETVLTPEDRASLALGFREEVRRRTTEFETQSADAVSRLSALNQQLATLATAQLEAGQEAIRFAERKDLVGSYLDGQLRTIERTLLAYHELATDGAVLCERILKVQRAISRVARRAETPALNVSLQASKAGARGRPMAVIANEMVVVSRKVAMSTQRVEEHAKVLLEALPGLKEHARELVDHGKRCASELDTMLRALDAQNAQTRAELRQALRVIERVRDRVSAATQVTTEHFGFAEQVRRPLEAIREVTFAWVDGVIEAQGVQSGQVEAMDWSTEETEEIETGELILF